ncbi:hypothetical protein K439DRAFT_1511163 [Ramaria rubella]|nr:hypothetical protein K439DRAFT_1511163 [Ramaria rubella]
MTADSLIPPLGLGVLTDATASILTTQAPLKPPPISDPSIVPTTLCTDNAFPLTTSTDPHNITANAPKDDSPKPPEVNSHRLIIKLPAAFPPGIRANHTVNTTVPIPQSPLPAKLKTDKPWKATKAYTGPNLFGLGFIRTHPNATKGKVKSAWDELTMKVQAAYKLKGKQKQSQGLLAQEPDDILTPTAAFTSRPSSGAAEDMKWQGRVGGGGQRGSAIMNNYILKQAEISELK